MDTRIQKKTGNTAPKWSAKPAEAPTPPPSAIPKPDRSLYGDVAHCYPAPSYYNGKESAVPYTKKFELEKRYNAAWSAMTVPQYEGDFTEAAYIERFGPSGLEMIGNVLTLRGIAMKGNGSSPAMTAFINTISAFLFSELITAEQLREMVRSFDKAEKNKKPTEAHNPMAWNALNATFQKHKIPIALHTQQMEGIDAVCMKRYYQKKEPRQ